MRNNHTPNPSFFLSDDGMTGSDTVTGTRIDSTESDSGSSTESDSDSSTESETGSSMMQPMI